MTYEHPEAPDPERLSNVAAEAQARIIEDAEEWEIADEEGGDGGSAVKLLPAAEMAQARAFQQGLNRAVKAEEKYNRNYMRGEARNRQRGDRCGGKGTNGHDEGYPALKPSVERKGEIKYHTANEKKMREKAAQDSDSDGWGIIGENDGEAAGQKDGSNDPNRSTTSQHNTTDTSQNTQRNKDPNYIPPHKRGVEKRTLRAPRTKIKHDPEAEEDLINLAGEPRKAPPPPQRLMARMKLLDAYEDPDGGGVPLI